MFVLELFNGMPIWLPHASILFRWDASGNVGWGAAVWTHPEDSEPTARAGGYWENEMLIRHVRKRQGGAGLLTGNAGPSPVLAGADGASAGRQSHSECGSSRVPRVDVISFSHGRSKEDMVPLYRNGGLAASSRIRKK